MLISPSGRHSLTLFLNFLVTFRLPDTVQSQTSLMAVSPALSLLFFILPTVTGQKVFSPYSVEGVLFQEGIALFQCRNETSRLSGGSEQENVVQERISSFEGCVLPHNRNKKEDRQFCYVYSSKVSSNNSISLT